MTCAITTSFLGCLVTTLLFFRYAFFLDISFAAKTAVFLLFIMMGCIPLFVSYEWEKVLGNLYPFYRYFLYFVFISCIILFTLTLFRDALWMIGCKLGLLPSCTLACCRAVNLATIALSLLAGGWALYEGIKVPEIKEISIISDKIKNERTIAVLSDLHIHRAINPEKIKKIVEKTNAQNPDMILLAGDIIDDEVGKVSDTTALLRGLKAKEGIYFVTGNHEFYAGYRQTVDELKKSGFTFLENNGIKSGEDVYLAGIPDLFSSRSYGKKVNIDQAFTDSHPENFRILMSHTPGDFAPNNNFDLEISGHTHGGQIFPFHIFAWLHNKYLAGMYRMDDKAQIYVSRGAGQWGPQMRFLAPSEITIIKLIPENFKGEK